LKGVKKSPSLDLRNGGGREAGTSKREEVWNHGSLVGGKKRPKNFFLKSLATTKTLVRTKRGGG